MVSKQQKTEIFLKGPNLPVTQDCSLGAFILDKLTKYDDRISQIFSLTGESSTHLEVKNQSIRVAKELRARGVGLGDVISICSTNSPISTLPLLAGIYLGAPISPLDPTLIKSDVINLMNITIPKIIFTQQSCLQIIEEVINELHLSTEIVVFGESDKHSTFSEFLSPSNDENNFEPVNFTNPEDHLAFLMSSSGTTGLPKCVAISHSAILYHLQLLLLANIPPGVAMLNMSTLFWLSGVMITLIAITIGGIRILTPSFAPEHTLETIVKYKIEWLIIGVTYYARTVSYSKACDYDLSCVKSICICGAKASDQHLIDGKKLFTQAEFTSGYGLTETTGVVFKWDNTKPKSVGQLIPGYECKIIDVENGTSLGPNQEGEICFRGKYIFSGYYKNEKATNEAVDKDGWLHTGDLGYYDEEENFYVQGRLKEHFKCQGWQISTLELEEILCEHPAIKEAAVIGVSHSVDVARPFAFIVKQPKLEITKDEIHLYMKGRVNSHKQLTGGIVFIDDLPITPSGKIRKRDLIELAKQYTTNDDE